LPLTSSSMRFVNGPSPELKLVLAKEYRDHGGGTQMVKFDRIETEKR